MKKQEIMDNSIDYSLLTTCADMIQHFCTHTPTEHVLDCLKVSMSPKIAIILKLPFKSCGYFPQFNWKLWSREDYSYVTIGQQCFHETPEASEE